jgi:hypothetical protein
MNLKYILIFNLNLVCRFKKIISKITLLFILSGCQTSDFGLVLRDDKKASTGQDPVEVTKPSDESLDNKKVDKDKLFNISSKDQVRPKVGLILSPGLSYTLSHLGVLKSLNDQKIPIHAIAGMEWSSLIAANYALNGAVNDMRWKAFQGAFSIAVNTGFLSGGIKETSNSIYEDLISQYTRGKSISQSRFQFVCPSLNVPKNKNLFYKSGPYASALKACMKVPPLAQTESNSWAYILELKGLIQQLKFMGAEKIIYVNALPATGMVWGKSASSVDARDKFFWSQVVNELNSQKSLVDHVLDLNPENHTALDFKNPRQMIEVSEQRSNDFFSKFARTYSF